MIKLDDIKRAPASAGILDIIARRWWPRAFSERPVSAEDLQEIFTAASWAASSTNEQPWRFHTGTANPYALHDTGAASAYLALQATALGLYAHGIGGFDRDKARSHFNVPADFDIGACWAIGYLGNPDALPENLKNRELAPRSRKPITDFVFAVWNVPAHLSAQQMITEGN